MKNNEDILRKLCIRQGYVPKDCQLDGQIIMLLTQEQHDACKGCNIDRSICHGRKF